MAEEETKPIESEIKLDFKFDLNKIKELKEKKEKKLEEVMAFLYESFGKSQYWNELSAFQQYCLVEQAFLIHFASFPARIVCAATLAALDEDEYYLKQDETVKMDIRNVIKALALKLKPVKTSKSFTINFKDSEEAKKLIEQGIDKKLFVCLFGLKEYQRIAAKWGKFQFTA